MPLAPRLPLREREGKKNTVKIQSIIQSSSIKFNAEVNWMLIVGKNIVGDDV